MTLPTAEKTTSVDVPTRVAASVIILTYNARDFVETCLSAVLSQTWTDCEVIVVDNASPDGTAEFVRARFPQVRLIASPNNGGYGAGNNLGAKYASGDTLVFLNPDAVPAPDWLENLLSTMRRQGHKLATSKIVLQSDPLRLNSAGNLIHYLGLSFCRGLYEPAGRYPTPEVVSGASGAACAISRELFARIGGFDPGIFLYHDDVDLSLRSMLAGESCLYVPSAVVAHDYELTVTPAKWRWIECYRYVVLLKAFRLRTFLVLLPALLVVDLITFTYLATLGPDYVAAKLNGYRLLLAYARDIPRLHRDAQRVRAVSDRDLLKSLVDQIPYEQLAKGATVQLGRAIVDRCFHLYRQVALALIR